MRVAVSRVLVSVLLLSIGEWFSGVKEGHRPPGPQPIQISPGQSLHPGWVLAFGALNRAVERAEYYPDRMTQGAWLYQRLLNICSSTRLRSLHFAGRPPTGLFCRRGRLILPSSRLVFCLLNSCVSSNQALCAASPTTDSPNAPSCGLGN